MGFVLLGGERFWVTVLEFLGGGVIVATTFVTTTLASLVVLPSGRCLKCFSFGALAYLFYILTIMYTLGGIEFFCVLTEGVIRTNKGVQDYILVLICVAFVNSVLVTGSVTLLAFLPLKCCILSAAGRRGCVRVAFVLRGVTTGLNNVLAPFNGPRGLCLCSCFGVSGLRFVKVVTPYFLITVVLVALYYVVFVGPRGIVLRGREIGLPPTGAIACLLLFTLDVTVIFHKVPC